MNICVPTTLKEWQAADEADGPFLLVSLTEEKIPRWVSTNSQGECDRRQDEPAGRRRGGEAALPVRQARRGHRVSGEHEEEAG